jgi:uncharacterized protein DUF2330
MARRLVLVMGMAAALLLAAPVAAFACGGLVAPGHAEVLQKATTLVAWHDGLEHYVTGFQFAGGANSFGYIIPLPGVPSKIQKAGEWTLERLELEVNPVREFALAAGAPAASDGKVSVLQRVRVDALDITVVRGGGRDVAAWAAKNGFDLTPDTPDVLGRYSSSGAVFALAKFDGLAATREGLTEGQGTVIHFTIPTKAPWVPLRILALGKSPAEFVDADVFILTDHAPALSPVLGFMPGVSRRFSGTASPSLLRDLRSDRGMSWLPSKGMWLSAYQMHTQAGFLPYDLSIDGGGPQSLPAPGPASASIPAAWPWVLGGLVAAAASFLVIAKMPAPAPARTRR